MSRTLVPVFSGAVFEAPRSVSEMASGGYPALQQRGFSQSVVERAVREVPWESRSTILKRVEKPKYCKECKGTPRQEYQKGMIDGIRVVPTFNPYVKLNKAKRYVLDHWPSRNAGDWDPLRCYVRGSRRRYDVPKDIFPSKDELGEWHPPSGEFAATFRRRIFEPYHKTPVHSSQVCHGYGTRTFTRARFISMTESHSAPRRGIERSSERRKSKKPCARWMSL